MEILSISLLSGISYGMVLFLLAAGLSLVFGLMGIVQLAHGAIFMLGGYIGITAAKATGNSIFGIFTGATACGIVGLVLERGFLRHLYQQHLEQILVTFGFVFIITNITLWIWGPWPKSAFIPTFLAGSVPIKVFHFPIYRFAIIIIGLAIFFCLWWLQDRTRVGALVRAGMEDAEMVSGLGINLTPITIGAFFFGSFLAGFAGVVGAPLLGGINSDTGISMLFVAIAVCIVGGVDSIQGSLVGALLIGIIHTLTVTYFPLFAMFTTYILMIIILLFRPSGLLGKKS